MNILFIMNKFNLCLLSISIILTGCANPSAQQGVYNPEVVITDDITQSLEPLFVVAFGSCSDENKPQPMLDRAVDQNPDVFVYLGDNIYGDTYDMSELKEKYDQLRSKPEFVRLWQATQVQATWDDHDYGINDGGGSYKNKIKAQQLFNDFWNIPSNDIRRSREGIYFSAEKIIGDKSILIVGLDTRYFRSDLDKVNDVYVVNNKPNATILGNDQWQWLKGELSKQHDVLIIATSIQLLATEHRFEKWSNFPNERAKILTLLNNLDSTVLIISGDRHRGGIYKQGDLVEITSSSLNRGLSSIVETDKLLLGKTHTIHNYGIIELTNSYLNLYLKDENMNILESLEIPLK